MIQGDNLEVLRALVETHEGRIDLIYIDPPFNTGRDFGGFGDQWSGLQGFLAMLRPRLELMRALLAPHGSFYLHIDPTAGHYVKVMLDEIFGIECFQREIVWRIGWLSGYKTTARNWIRNHDTIFFYTKDPSNYTFQKLYVPYPVGYKRRDGKAPEGRGVPMEDVWNANSAEEALTGSASLDSIQIKSFSTEKTGWPTQKNESLLRRIIEASSDPGGLVADFFAGSGTTAVAAQQLGRRFLACDLSEEACALAQKRLDALGSSLFQEASDYEFVVLPSRPESP